MWIACNTSDYTLLRNLRDPKGGLWRLNTEKSVSLTDNDVQTFLEGEENKMRKEKTESHVFSGFGNGISCGWERKSTTRRFATSRFWPCTWKISSDGKVQFNNWQFCTLKIRPIVCFWSDSTHFFILSTPTRDLYLGIVDPSIFIY